MLLSVKALTAAAELFPGWGHPALWCLSALLARRSWRCPEARDVETNVWEKGGKFKKKKKKGGGGLEMQPEMILIIQEWWTKWMQLKRNALIHIWRENKSRRDMSGMQGKKLSSLLFVSKKTKVKGRKFKHIAAEHERQTMHGWQEMQTDKTIQTNFALCCNLLFRIGVQRSQKN